VYTERLDVRRFADSEKRSIEDAGRTLRYRFFAEVMRRESFTSIAVAHHADDQAETLLLQMARGSGLKGLMAMRPKTGSIVRPLLFATRSEIETYAASRDIPFRIDSSNMDPQYRRNRIRIEVVDALRSLYGEAVIRSICRAADAAAEASEVVEHASNQAFERVAKHGTRGEIILDICLFFQYFKAIQKSVLSMAVSRLSEGRNVLHFETYARLLRFMQAGQSGRGVLLPGGIQVVKSGKTLVLYKDAFVESETRTVRLGEPLLLTDGSRLLVRLQAEPVSFHDKNPEIEFADADKAGMPLVIRASRPGDRFMPLGMSGEKRVKDFFIDQKVPNYLRRRIPLLCGPEHTVWIVGLRLDDRVRITEKTRRILRMERLP
jgi:tRNA(Ile)-lysidine synthase